MKTKLIIGAAVACVAALALEAAVARPAIAAVEAGLDGKYAGLWPGDQFLVLGTTRGLYLDGYGAVFTTELKLVTGLPVTPMTPAIPPKDYIEQVYKEKIERVAKLRTAMRGFLADTASSLDMVPADQQIVLAVTLSRYRWEQTANVPTHILMQGRRSDLLSAKAAGPAALDQAIKVQEY
ncbi:MAG TPA: hypothetical protein VFA04_14135 [Bryobacteraceae bacterium]|nr:hypothetical protein [Bryobacteraceae bacterium]